MEEVKAYLLVKRRPALLVLGREGVWPWPHSSFPQYGGGHGIPSKEERVWSSSSKKERSATMAIDCATHVTTITTREGDDNGQCPPVLRREL